MGPMNGAYYSSAPVSDCICLNTDHNGGQAAGSEEVNGINETGVCQLWATTVSLQETHI